MSKADDCFEKLKAIDKYKTAKTDALKKMLSDLEDMRDHPQSDLPFEQRAKAYLHDKTIGRLKDAYRAAIQTERNLELVNRLEGARNKDGTIDVKKLNKLVYSPYEGSFTGAPGEAVQKDVLEGALFYNTANRFVQHLEKDGAFDYFRAIKNTDVYKQEVTNVMEALGILQSGKGDLKGYSPSVKAVANAIFDYQKYKLSYYQKVGGTIEEMANHFIRNTTDRAKVLAEDGGRGWIEYMVDAVKRGDVENPIGSPEAWASAIHDDILTERFYSAPGANKLDQRLSARREIRFTNAKAATDYMFKYGHSVFMDNVMQDIRSFSRNAAIMRIFGPLPDDGITAFISAAKRMGADISNSQTDILRAELMGTTRRPVTGAAYKFLKDLKTLQIMAKTYGSTISAIPDWAKATANMMANTEGGYIKNSLATLESFARAGIDPKTKAMIARTVSVALDHELSEYSNPFQLTGNEQGKMGKLLQLSFKWQGVELQARMARNSVALLLNSLISEQAHLPFESIDKELNFRLKRAGIDEHMWDALKHAVVDVGDGRKLLQLDNLDNVDLSSLHAASGADASPALWKEDIKTRMASFLVDAANHTVPTGSAKVRRQLYWGTDPNTPGGAALRLVSTLKSFIFEMAHDLQYYSLTREGNRIRGVQTLGGFAMSSIALGALTAYVKAITKGQTPPATNTPDFWIEAIQRSGVGFYYGDLLLQKGQTGSDNLTNMLKYVAGPAITEPALAAGSAVSHLYRLTQKDRYGRPVKQNFAPDVQLLKRNLPLINNIYTDAVMTQYLMPYVLEATNPGWEARWKKRMDKIGQKSLLR
jgi:alkylhydroperoxidase/carboxymuconolactone decarboxylase family protein YurZ